MLTNASQKKLFYSIPATVIFYLIKQCAITHNGTSATTPNDIYEYR